MKVTGVVLICLGIIGAAFCGISNMSWKSHTQDSGAEQADKGRAPNMTVPLMHALVEGGADVIELGVPFSDPMADGPVIQRASERALAQGVSLRQVFDFVKEFRKTNNQTPVVLMGYANPIEAMGAEHFADLAKATGVDGVLVVDYPPEEAQALVKLLDARSLDTIFLLSPTTRDAGCCIAAF